MPGQAPRPGRDGDPAASSASRGGDRAASAAGARPRFGWVAGSAETEPMPVPGARRRTAGVGWPTAVPAGAAGVIPAGGLPGGFAGGGLAGGLDQQVLLEALAAGGFLDGRGEDQDAVLADELEAAADGRMGPPDPAATAALAVEYMDPGPALAGWLGVAAAAAGTLDENGLAGVAIAARKLASWAQAAELAAVAQITARAAAADRRIGVRDDGRPARVGRDALGQVGLALMLSDYGAAGWADLAVTLGWRLRGSGAALAAGLIDLSRARVIAEATSVLTEETARAVEAEVLPGAGAQTTAQLRARLRRAVIAADPDGAERRQAEAERAARVCLYGDQDGTATLTGAGLPAVQAAAAMARITAIARAMKAAGQAGGLDLHRAQVMLGLLLGTLPYIPPPDGAPPDGAPPDGAPPGQPAPSDPGPSDSDPGPGPGGPGPGQGGPGRDGPGGRGGSGPDGGVCPDGARPDDLPAPRDEDAPPDDGLDDAADAAGGLGGGSWDGDDDDDDDMSRVAPAPGWPALGVIPPALARPPRPEGGRPVPGLLDVTLPWATLAGLSAAPGTLGRIGPVTPGQARLLAQAAENDPAAQWRIIITNPAGQAIAVTRIRRRARHGPGPPGTGLVGRATVIISQDTISQQAHAVVSRSRRAGGRRGPDPPPAGTGGPGPPAGTGGPGPPGGIAATALRAAARALDRALAQAEADVTAGGCAHASESAAYRPPPRLREHVAARDVTCRFRTCGQPAWRADLDHTIPYDQHGRTCRCNLGGGCRKHHQLKQHPRWQLEQTQPGEFIWTTPAGRTYTTGPDIHPL